MGALVSSVVPRRSGCPSGSLVPVRRRPRWWRSRRRPS